MLLLVTCIIILLHLLSLPWWTAVLVVFVFAAFRPASAKIAFLNGILGMSVPWLTLCCWSVGLNGVRLTGRISGLLSLPHWAVLVLLTALLGGLTGGLAGLSGEFFGRTVRRANWQSAPQSGLQPS